MLSEALRLIRVFHDAKQTDLADRIGVSKSYISELESGKKSPTLEVIEKYSKEFSIPSSSILFFSEQLSADKSVKGSNKRKFIASKIIQILNFIDEKAKVHQHES
ncbi:XRE family transcriptional regulator [Siculibacillus lacustris]|uniref:XRE family transcriptional regulator n=1 Tax=Siculibacillus lacustris TaxID=1549641 RepID=A0A4Q9VDT5_9HYPH|nr:XRE family transcriptional regulator [Siculibacillus lacustris]